MRHPLHPALAHFPLAFLLGASISDGIAYFSDGQVWWLISHHAISAGVAVGFVAMMAGAVDACIHKIPDEAIPWLLIHAGGMLVVLACFTVSLALRETTPPPMSAVWISSVGSLLLLISGFCGGTLVYRFGVGTSWLEKQKKQ